MNKIPEYLEPYPNGDLVNYREFQQNKEEGFQVHDKTLHHICFASTAEMAELIVESINMLFKIRKVENEK